MKKSFAGCAETAGPIGHQSLALGLANFLAQIGLAGCAETACTAFGGVQRYDMISGLDAADAGADFCNHRPAFMTQYCREKTLRVGARQGEGVGVADVGRDHAQQDFALRRAGNLDLLDLQWLARLPGDSGFRFHRLPPRYDLARTG